MTSTAFEPGLPPTRGDPMDGDGSPATGAVFAGRELACIRGERPVFAGLSFRLPPGGALVLAGPNGSGKSSLLRVMAGLIAPAAGHLEWDGEPASAQPEQHRARLHYLGHQEALKPVLTVAENLRFWSSLGGGSAAAAERALERFQLDHLAEVAGRLLSSGQRRRLALARLLASPAPLWLLDEPSVGLDAASIRRLTEVIAEHRAAGGAVAVATHQALDLPGAESLAMDDYPAAPISAEELVW